MEIASLTPYFIVLFKVAGAAEEGGTVQEGKGARGDVLRPGEAVVLRAVESSTQCTEVITGRVRYDQERSRKRGCCFIVFGIFLQIFAIVTC